MQNACAHLGLPLDFALVSDGTIVCPHRGFAYELASGECLTARGVRLRVHAVRVTGDDVAVKLSRQRVRVSLAQPRDPRVTRPISCSAKRPAMGAR